MAATESHRRNRPPSTPAVAPSAWWMLVHQVPPDPPGVRMRVWRRLAALGALQVKGSVYLLPATDAAREDLEWLLQEIRAAGGDGTVWRAEAVAGLDADELVRRFQASAEAEYDALHAELADLQQSVARKRRPLAAHLAKRRLGKLRTQFDEIASRDHFQAPRREVVGALLATIEGNLTGGTMHAGTIASDGFDTSAYRGRTWVTRARVRVDRMASAWLIRRFIDPSPTFSFVADAQAATAGSGVRFDMYGGEFTHEGDACTFEVLVRRFGLDVPGLDAIARIVHDIDLKEDRYGLPETAGIAASLDAIASSNMGDEERIAFAATLFDGLLARFAAAAGTGGTA